MLYIYLALSMYPNRSEHVATQPREQKGEEDGQDARAKRDRGGAEDDKR
jgi:hypothetical protein